jgi:hypothetical protein
MRTTTKLLVLVLISTFLGACASRREPEQISPGSVALVAAHYAPASDFNAYAYGRGANALVQGGRTAAIGAAIGIAPLELARLGPVGAVVGVMIAVPLAVAGSVIGGTVGLVAGAANGMPADQVHAIHQPVEHARRYAAIQTTMSQQVLALGGNLPQHRLTYLPHLGPTSSSQTPDYQALKAQGFQCVRVLELAVTSIGFEATQGEPPSAVFEMKLRARVVPLTTDAKPWTREQTYRGWRRTLPEWQADEGKLFQEELDASYRSLAQYVSEEMFSSAVAVVRMAEPVATSSLPLPPTASDTWSYPSSWSPTRAEPVATSSVLPQPPIAGDTWSYPSSWSPAGPTDWRTVPPSSVLNRR